MVTLHYGDNGQHEFWEGKSLIIFRNKPEKIWQSQKKDHGSFTVIDDIKATIAGKKNHPNLVSVTLAAPSSGQLAKKIVIQEGIEIEFDYTKVFKGKPPMRLQTQRPPNDTIKDSKKR
jgi:hypothetical protein